MKIKKIITHPNFICAFMALSGRQLFLLDWMQTAGFFGFVTALWCLFAKVFVMLHDKD